MKKICSVLILLFLIQLVNAQDFEVEIWQNNKKLKVKNDVIQLKKEPFQIKLKLEDLYGAYLIPTFTGEPSETVQENIKNLNLFAMSEYEFNQAKHLGIHETAIHFLFFDSEMDWHRFDKNGVEVIENTVIGTKTVEVFQNDLQPESIPIEKIGNDLYLIFIATEEVSDTTEEEIIKMEKLVLKWK